MRSRGIPIHEDKALNHDWWKERGIIIGASAGAQVRYCANFMRDASGRYDGYLILLEFNRHNDDEYLLTVRTVAEAEAALKQLADVWFIPNPQSAIFLSGYDCAVASGWWKGCPFCHDTQEFCDWIAGWNRAHAEGFCPNRSIE